MDTPWDTDQDWTGLEGLGGLDETVLDRLDSLLNSDLIVTLPYIVLYIGVQNSTLISLLYVRVNVLVLQAYRAQISNIEPTYLQTA